MRIVDIVMPFGGRSGGGEFVIDKLGCRLAQRGYHVRIVQMTSDGYRWMDDSIEFCPLLINSKVERVDDFIGMYASFLQTHESPTVVIATPWPFMACAAKEALKMVGLCTEESEAAEKKETIADKADGNVTKHFCGVNVIVWLHGPVETYKKYGTGGYECLSFADCCFTLTKRAASQINVLLPDMRTELVGNPVRLKGVNPLERWNRDAHNLRFVGRLSYEKRVDVIIEALSQTRHRWNLQVFGSGDEEVRLHELAAASGVTDCVTWNGWKDDPWETYDDVTALVIASEYEGFCMAAVEALARGIPVISTPVDGVIEYVKPGVNGYLYSKGNSAGLAEILDAIDEGVLPDIEPRSCVESAACFEEDAVLDNMADIVENMM